jgi:hypothetical protein
VERAIIGRESELASGDEFLEGVSAGSRALVLEGEPGIGKTTVWRETEQRARQRGYLVLVSRPAQSEAKLSFAGLNDLLANVSESTFDSVPGPQRNALNVDLLRRGRRAATDQRTIAVALPPR